MFTYILMSIHYKRCHKNRDILLNYFPYNSSSDSGSILTSCFSNTNSSLNSIRICPSKFAPHPSTVPQSLSPQVFPSSKYSEFVSINFFGDLDFVEIFLLQFFSFHLLLQIPNLCEVRLFFPIFLLQ